MLFHNLPDPWDEEAITTHPSPIEFTAKPIGEQPKAIKVSVKPSGEFNFEGVADDDIIRQMITTTDYNRSATRNHELEILKQSKNVDMMTLGVLASSILVSLLCLLLSFNSKQQSQGSANNGQFLRGISCEQIR